MKGYKIYEELRWGGESSETKHSVNYGKAIQIFNDFIKKATKENKEDLVNEEDFREEIVDLREHQRFNKKLYKDGSRDFEIICRKYPVLIYKYNKTNKMVANVYFWERTSYEYQEYDIESQTFILEEIEIIE
ncbi:hypothetical protein D4A35_03320 [Paraclostridium bifermentans]|uniref:Uncharacterized protein n=1 Tax=Paraclostridium bifermentans TaxID=1490 RepID=A0A5P3XBE3_PARBF|nr:hypothetical protein [Paraclostridium bifermentans]QEZ68012.1 hypothetical protein D4A35_03320 [Paraclostridium bifermentans]